MLSVIVFALAFLLSFTYVSEVPQISKNDVPVYVYTTEMEVCVSDVGSVTLALDSNITTGMFWNAWVREGDSVEIEDPMGVYESDPNPEFLDGVGGTTYYRINALKSGDTLVCFSYGCGEKDADMIVLFTVDDDLHIHAYDVTDMNA